jgi:hypothetical protein
MATWILIAAVVGGAAAAPSPRLAPEKVREALEWGRGATEDDLKQYELRTAENWSADFDTPFLRVGQLAAALARRGKVLLPEDVPERSLDDEWHVYLHARQADGTPTSLPNFEYVTVLRPVGEGRSESVLPISLNRFVRQVPIPGYFGPARVAQSVRAAFPAGSLVPGGELRVVLHGGRVESIPIDAALLARVK